ncbi:nonstructural protein [Microvirus mar16]|uniref:Nonstructural protein n=1 Tax=Microvirus mar16 TaxID=2851148 RepID=A0A8F6AI75_9VIRU|nr:nonstructural protein [Microvirus mar16]
MITKIYTIYDRKSGIYGNPFFSQNDACAERDFKAFCAMPQNSYLAEDLELYDLGKFDSDTGEIVGWTKPEFLTGYANQKE